MIFLQLQKFWLTTLVAGYFFDSRGNFFASIKQLSHQGSVDEPELFDEFARTQKIPVDFWSRQIGGFQ